MNKNKSQTTPKAEEKLSVVLDPLIQSLQTDFSFFRVDSEKFQETVATRLEKLSKDQEADRQAIQRQFERIGDTFNAFTHELNLLNRGHATVSATTITGAEFQELEKTKKIGKETQLPFLPSEEMHYDDGYDTPDDDEMLDRFKELTGGKGILTMAAEDLPARKRKSGKSESSNNTVKGSSIGLTAAAAAGPTKSDGTTKRATLSAAGNPDGGGGDDDDDDPPRNPRNSAHPPDDKKKKDRRRSSHFVDLITATDNRNLTAVNVTRVQAPYDHIMLKYLRINHAVRFFDQFKTYQFVNSVQLAMTHQVADSVRKQLLAHHPKLTLQGFYSLTNEQLITLIQTHVRPRTTLEFLKVMKDSLEFKYESKDAPSPTRFLAFYTSLLLYRDDFFKLYDLISAYNEHIIPPCTDKEGGLIKLFNEKILFDYGKLVYRSLKTTRYEDIHDFIDDFYDIVEKDYRLSQAARAVSEHFGGTEYEVKSGGSSLFRSVSARDDDRHGIKQQRNDAPAGPYRGNNNFKRKYSPGHKLQAIRAAADSDDEIDPTNGLISQDEGDGIISNDDDEESGLQEDSPSKKTAVKKLNDYDDEDDPAPYMQPARIVDPDDSEQDSGEPDDTEDRIIAAMEAYHNNSGKPANAVGCFYRMTGKPCRLGDKCRFSHDYKDLVKAYEYYHNLLAQSKYKTPTGILRKAGTKT